MKTIPNKLLFFTLLTVGLFTVVPANAFGGEIVARAVTHQSTAEILQYVIGAIVGAALLAGLAAFMFSPRPSNVVLGGLAMAGATGMIHLMMGFIWGSNLFVLNGIGFFGLAIFWALPTELFPRQKTATAVALAIYTLVTIGAYLIDHIGSHFDFLGILAKVIEVLLLIAIGLSLFRSDASS